MKTLLISLLLVVLFACEEEQIEPTSVVSATTSREVDNARTKPNRSCDPAYYEFLLGEKQWVEQTIRIITIMGREERLPYYYDYLHVVKWELTKCSI